MSGIYISYPFCAQKCTFCNFASGVHAHSVQRRYFTALVNEMRTHAWRWPPDTLYLGGGTPSLIPVDELAAIKDALPPGDLKEFTLEAAPGSITAQRVAAWATLGVNRVSLGVQSFVDAELRQTGRRHNAHIVKIDISLLRDHGISNINVDLIAGLPHQTGASWRESLEWIAALRPPHVSVYNFEIDEDSRLGKEVVLRGNRYGATSLPSDDQVADFYEAAAEYLAQLGIRRYEISNFALPGYESLHNLKYWKLEPYIGFGLDAHSFDGEYRWSNPDSLDQYLTGGGRAERDAASLSEEHFFVGLRLSSGIEPSDKEWEQFAAPIAKWTGTGLLEREGNRLRLTGRGLLLSNEILEDFIHV